MTRLQLNLQQAGKWKMENGKSEGKQTDITH